MANQTSSCPECGDPTATPATCAACVAEAAATTPERESAYTASYAALQVRVARSSALVAAVRWAL